MSNNQPNDGGSADTELPRFQKVLIFTLGTIERLIDAGLITGPKVLTEGGRAQLAALKAEGFTPTTEETELAMRAIMPTPEAAV